MFGIFALTLRTGDSLAVSRTDPDILEMFPLATDHFLRDCSNLRALVAAEVEYSDKIHPYGATGLRAAGISLWSRMTCVVEVALPVDTNCAQTH